MSIDPSRTSLEAEVSMEKAALEVAEDPPFHILVMGDFSGCDSGDRTLKPLQIDRDDYEAVMRTVGPRVLIDAGEGKALGLKFEALDDFHPDTLFRSISLFDELRGLRKGLLDPDQFRTAAREVRSWFSDEEAPVAEEKEPEQPVEVEGSDALLDDILGSRTREAAAYKPQKETPLREFVRKAVDPYIIRVDEEEQSKLIDTVDSATGGIMKTIIHDRGFRQLEALWRGLYLMCRRIETSKDLKIFLLDITKERFVEELKKGRR